jgi:CDP-glucose 4,6-dehydratase
VAKRKGAVEGLAVNGFWKGKSVLLTGHTGFKGGWLTLWLHRLGANVTGLSLRPESTPNLFSAAKVSEVCDSHIGDIRDHRIVDQVVKGCQPEVIFHLAAQPLVRRSYRLPQETFDVNVMGSVNLLEAVRQCDSVRVVVMVTTDKVYRNHEWHWPYREDDILGGHDPYSASKAAAEILISSYRDAFLRDRGSAVATARAGNVIGGGDWSEDRLIPDAIRCWGSGSTLEIRRPDAIRPWQHVLEPLAGYLRLAEALHHRPELAGAYNFGPTQDGNATVRQVIEVAKAAYGVGEVKYCQEVTGPHEAGNLRLDISKSYRVLGFQPKWDLQQAIIQTVDWYLKFDEGYVPCTLCGVQIEKYMSTAS